MEEFWKNLKELIAIIKYIFNVGDEANILHLDNRIRKERRRSDWSMRSSKRKEHEDKLLKLVREKELIQSMHPEWIIDESEFAPELIWMDGSEYDQTPLNEAELDFDGEGDFDVEIDFEGQMDFTDGGGEGFGEGGEGFDFGE